MAAEDQIDWSECPLIEVKREVHSGDPVLLGTRMPVSAIVDNFDHGLSVSEIAEQFELPLHRVEAIVDYAQSHRAAHRVWRIVFDKNVPVGVRRFLSGHVVRTFTEMQWHPQLENGELLMAAETAGFDVMVTSDQSIRYQQNLRGRKLALLVAGSNIWPIVREHGATDSG